jgi:hypothetical protein
MLLDIAQTAIRGDVFHPVKMRFLNPPVLFLPAAASSLDVEAITAFSRGIC